MNNAAIIIFIRSTLPKVLKFFAVPRIIQIIETGNAEEKVKVHIIECPVMRKSVDNRKIARNLYGLCVENNISFFIGKNIEYYLGSGLENMESSIERGNIDEIRALKDLAALIKLSCEKNINLLKKNMCFIGESHSYQYISIMSEEAAGVYIFEHDKMSDILKKAVFESLMAEKGISAVFTKDLDRAISESDIILADDSVVIDVYQMKLSGKILIGKNAAEGNIEKIGRELLWYDSLDHLAKDDIIICFNDELLGILRYFYREKNPIGFLKRFPYIYLYVN